MFPLLLAAVLFTAEKNGIELRLESETAVIDPAKSVFLRVELKSPSDRKAVMPDLRDRVVGFSLAEDFVEEPETLKDGSQVQVTNWRLVPEPCAAVYKLKPFVVKASPKVFQARSDEGAYSFVGGPVYFENPPPREPVTGAMEIDPKKDFPPLSWKLVGWVSLVVLAVLAVLTGLFFGLRYISRRVKEHRMSPIERAWVELDRLLKKGLPGRGRYKDFYVELTMVVRRYVQRQHGVVAPHLTTEEFFDATRNSLTFPKSTLDELIDFLRKSDMIKFAGVKATPETADEATISAKAYIAKDDEIVKRKAKQRGGVQ